jgi:hypothetical protein
VPVAAGNIDPHAGCPTDAVTTCGRTGLCDGTGACQRYPVGTTCGSASCVGDTFTPAAACDGLGMCRTPASANCAPYGCNTAARRCNAGCPAGDTICAAGAYCTGDESCYPRKDPGVACGSNHECKSLYCVDGACCGADCAYKCLSCTGSADLGTCTALPSGTVCAAATCADTVLTPARTCNGVGICQQATPVSCSPYACRTDVPSCQNQ